MQRIMDRVKVVFLNRGERYYGVLAALLTIGILLLALSYGQMLGGKYKFIVGDLYEQCSPFANLFINKLLDGGNLYYSFNAGLGMNTSLLFAFYVFSPFNLLYIFSNGSNINTIAILVFVLKAGFASFCFCIYSHYNLKVKSFASVLLAVGYSLVSYGIVTLEMTSLYDGIYLLPLILVAIKYMIDKKKALWLIVFYAILFVSNFYSGYIVGLASFVYFLIYLILMKHRREDKRKIVLRYFICVICAFLLSSFILAPALFEVLKQNAVDDGYHFSIVHLWNMISFLFPFHKRELNQMLPYYYCGLPASLLIGAFFTNKSIDKKNILIGGILLLLAAMSMVYMPMYSAAHMFNDPNGYTFRYVYIIAFVISSMGIITFRYIDGVRVNALLAVDSVLLILHCLSPFLNKVFDVHDNSPTILFYAITFALVLAWAGLFISYIKIQGTCDTEANAMSNKCNIPILREKDLVAVSLILLAFELCLNTYVIMTSEQRYESELYDYRISQAKVLTSEMSSRDDSVYRIHYDWLMNPNQACLYNYYGTDLFASSMNLQLQEFLYSIGLQSETYYLTSNGNTDLIKILFDEKYNLNAFVQYSNENVNSITENTTAGFGYMVGKEAADYVISDNVFENQNAVYSALMGETMRPYSSYDGEVLLSGENTSGYMDEYGNAVFELIENADIGCVVIKVQTGEEDSIYSWISSGVNFVSPLSPVISSPDEMENCGYVESLLSAPHIVKMSKEEDGYAVYIMLSRGIVEEASLSDVCFAYYDDSYIKLLQEKLSKQSLNISSFEDGHVEGNVTAIESGICFISIPYEEGWTAIVDGEPHEITPLFNEAFIGVPLDAGYHEIELQFEAPYSRLGIGLSVVGIVMFCGIVLSEYMKSRKKSEE